MDSTRLAKLAFFAVSVISLVSSLLFVSDALAFHPRAKIEVASRQYSTFSGAVSSKFI